MKNALIGILLIGSSIPAFGGDERRFDPPPAQRPPPSYGQSLYPEQRDEYQYTPYHGGSHNSEQKGRYTPYQAEGQEE